MLGSVVEDNENGEEAQDESTVLRTPELMVCLEEEIEQDATTAPIESPFAKAEREKSSRDYFRFLLMPSSTNNARPSDDIGARVREHVALARSENLEAERRVLEEPDLRIPVGDEYLQLAQ